MRPAAANPVPRAWPRADAVTGDTPPRARAAAPGRRSHGTDRPRPSSPPRAAARRAGPRRRNPGCGRERAAVTRESIAGGPLPAGRACPPGGRSAAGPGVHRRGTGADARQADAAAATERAAAARPRRRSSARRPESGPRRPGGRRRRAAGGCPGRVAGDPRGGASEREPVRRSSKDRHRAGRARRRLTHRGFSPVDVEVARARPRPAGRGVEGIFKDQDHGREEASTWPWVRGTGAGSGSRVCRG